MTRATCDRANPCKNQSEMDAGQTNGRTHHEWLCAFGGWRRWRLFGTCERHVDNDFMNWSLVAERLIRPEPKRRRIRGRKIAKSIAARSLPYGPCHCHVTRDFTFFAFCTGTAGPIWEGRTPFESDRRRQDCLVDYREAMGSNPVRRI